MPEARQTLYLIDAIAQLLVLVSFVWLGVSADSGMRSSAR